MAATESFIKQNNDKTSSSSTQAFLMSGLNYLENVKVVSKKQVTYDNDVYIEVMVEAEVGNLVE